MKTIATFATALIMTLAAPVASLAQAPAAAADKAGATMTDGVIQKVDASTGKLTIKHGPIAHMDMPGMTMVFTAQDKALLNGLKPGDKIRFMAAQEGGKMLVTAVSPAP